MCSAGSAAARGGNGAVRKGDVRLDARARRWFREAHAETSVGDAIEPGDLYVSGPGGLWILAGNCRHVGTINGPQLPANLAWDHDGRTLHLTAGTGLYRIRLDVRGAHL